MKRESFSFQFPESKTVRVVIIRLETGEIVARTVEELEKMSKEGMKYEIIEEVK